MTKGQLKRLSGMLRRVMQRWAPPSRMTVSEWADRNRRLSPEASHEASRWKTDRAPYQREMMDAVCDPKIEEVTYKTSSQVGKTECIDNVAGYFMDQDPSPILVLFPTLVIAESWSQERLAPMIRNTLCLKSKVHEARTRNSGNKILHKSFFGGHLTIAGANSPSSLSSRPIRIVLRDEVDRFPVSAGSEGDPIILSNQRTATFPNRKKLNAGSPTIEGSSRIDKCYEESDQRRYYVPCPHCGEKHLLEWGNIVWEKAPDGKHLPETAAHYCPHCGGAETDADLPKMLAGGEWRKGRPEVTNHAGFAINELYSPWVTFRQTVEKFLSVHHDFLLYRAWVNTSLGEVWKEGKSIGEAQVLLDRREQYDANIVPYNAAIITVGVDVQDDRLEVEAIAEGLHGENWSLETLVIPGNPAYSGIWDVLENYLNKRFVHESGLQLRIMGCGIDTGGHYTNEVYNFCKRMAARNVFALKGRGGQGHPIFSGPSKNNAGGVNLYLVGVDTIKDMVKAGLETTEPGPGYCHYPYNYETDYFDQLLAERPVLERKGGKIERVWKKKREGIRNEALDRRVYAKAALAIAYSSKNSKQPYTEIVNMYVQAVLEKAKRQINGNVVAMTPEARGSSRSGRRIISRGVA